MPTSGTTDLLLTGTDLVTESLLTIGAYDPGEAIPAAEMTDALRSLNMMLKSLQAADHRWLRGEAVLFLVNGQAAYSLPGANAGGYSAVVSTTLSAAAASGAGSVTLTSTTGISAADVIGIKQDDNTIHWTTVSAVGPPTTLGANLTAAAAAGNAVYAYTTATARPLRILDCRRRETTNGVVQHDIPMWEWSRQEYFDMPTKDTTGGPYNWFYTPGLSTGTLYLWPTPSDVDVQVIFTYLRSIEVFTSQTFIGDFPQEWQEWCVHQLAMRLRPKYGIPLSSVQDVAARADYLQAMMDTWDRETDSVRFVPDESEHWR